LREDMYVSVRQLASALERSDPRIHWQIQPQIKVNCFRQSTAIQRVLTYCNRHDIRSYPHAITERFVFPGLMSFTSVPMEGPAYKLVPLVQWIARGCYGEIAAPRPPRVPSPGLHVE